MPLTTGRLKVLQELYRAGPDGLPQLLMFGGKDLGALVDNQLAEAFTDPARILRARVRLTWIGINYARFFTEGVT